MNKIFFVAALAFGTTNPGLAKASLSPVPMAPVSLPGNLPTHLTQAARAVGQLVVKPYTNAQDGILCTASHIGGGFMLTLGSCFLGAQECNRGYVTFLGAPQPNGLPWVSPCQEVVYARGDAGRYRGPGEDLALFRVSNPPPFEVTLASQERVNRAQGAVSSVLAAQGSGGQPPSLVWSGLCSISGQTVPLRQFQPPAIFSQFNSCGIPHGGSGAPLFDGADGAMVGIQQTVLSRNKVLFPSRWLPVSKEQVNQKVRTIPREIWLGYSLNNGVPTVPPSPVKMRVLTLPNTLGSTASFSVRHLSQTIVLVEDGTGAYTTFRGFPREEHLSPRAYALPVRIYAYTEGDRGVLGAGITGLRVDP